MADFTRQYIDGQWRPGRAGTVLKDTNPWNGDLLTEITQASVGDLDEAYNAAAAAQLSWAQTPPPVRTTLLLNVVARLDARREEIISWLIDESGSTRIKSEMEFESVRSATLAAAMLPSQMHGQIRAVDIPDKESRVYRQPLGVIGVISPWNWPMHLTNRSVAPAIALGNAVVIKPADDTPVTGGLLLAEIYEEAGLPAGLLNVIVGDVDEIGDAFTLHPIPRFISFTGSTRVGRHIGQLAMSGQTLKHVGLELGGNAPCVVLDDADLDMAVHAAMVGRFLHQGQICMSTNRIIVDSSIYSEFVELFTLRVSALKCGDPRLPDTVIGPLINARQTSAAASAIREAKQSGLHLALGGEIKGQLIPPHIFTNVMNTDVLAQTELFAPVAPVIRADNEAHALYLANETEFGLSSCVFTRDETRGLRFAKSIKAGMTHINDISTNDDPYTMFGGEKNSGIGRFNSEWILREFTTDHWISVQYSPRTYPF
jgi:aldehyde dehydrogenase (NAD+)